MYSKINFRGYEGFIVDMRIKKEDRKEGYFYYDLRHDDDWTDPCTIEDAVFVNHWGTICFKESIDHLLTPWGENRLSTDLTEEEIESIWTAIETQDQVTL